MSWEAVTWGNRQKLKKSYEQIVLLVLANCADPNGEAFVKWPGRDHWWVYLSERTRLPKSSLFRHLNTIVALGLGERAMQVMADGSRRPTFRLNLAASFDIDREEDAQLYASAVGKKSENQSPVETGDDAEFDGDEIDNDISHSQGSDIDSARQSPPETENPQPQSPRETRSFPVLGLHKDSNSFSKDSPLPPSGGLRALDGFDEFAKAWGEPIPKLAVAQTAWEKIASDKRGKAIAAAKGYFAWLKQHPKPPATISAQAFLRDEAGWEQWLRYIPADQGGATLVPVIPTYRIDSEEGRAILALYHVGGGSLFEHGGKVRYAPALTPQIMAFAQVPDRWNWEWIEAPGQVRAWTDFIAQHVIGNRRVVVTTKGIGADQKRGLSAPWPWPPSATGKIYTSATGPPTAELSDADAADFK